MGPTPTRGATASTGRTVAQYRLIPPSEHFPNTRELVAAEVEFNGRRPELPPPIQLRTGR